MSGDGRLRWAVWAAAAAVLTYQLFIPPVVGLGDQGDFSRMIGRFGFQSELQPSIGWSDMQRTYVRAPHTRQLASEQATPEYALVGAAILLNDLISKDGKLDIVVLGLVHAAVFLAAFAWFLKVTEPLAVHRVVWVVSLLALTDVGYVAYWNSFFAEPASLLLFLLLVAESISICLQPGISTLQLLRWCLWAALWVTAKSMNFPLALILAPLAVRLGYWGGTRAARKAGIFGAALIASAAIANSLTIPRSVRVVGVYNHVFMALLPESRNVPADLKALGLDRVPGFEWTKYRGTGAWSPGSGFLQMRDAGILDRQLTPAALGRFYLFHPLRIWRRAKAVFPYAFSLRPEWCGNFEPAAGYPPGTRSTAFTLWSGFHQRFLPPWGRAILVLLLLAPPAFLLAWIRVPSGRMRIEFAAALAFTCLIAFLVPILSDAWDMVKHLFLFNLILDACLISALGWICSRFSARRPYSRDAPPQNART